MNKFSIPFILLSVIALQACDPDSSDSEASSSSSISSVSYDYTFGILAIKGTDLPTKIDGWDLWKLNITGHGSITLKAQTPETLVFQSKATSLTIVFKGSARSAVSAVLDKNGTKAADGTAYELAAKAVASTGSKTLRAGITVSNLPGTLSVFGASYNTKENILELSGLNLDKITAAQVQNLRFLAGAGHTLAGTAYAADNRPGNSNGSDLSAAEKWDWNTAKTKLWIKLNDRDAHYVENLALGDYLKLTNGAQTTAKYGLGLAQSSDFMIYTGPGMKLSITGNTVWVTAAAYDTGSNILKLTGTNVDTITAAQVQNLKFFAGTGHTLVGTAYAADNHPGNSNGSDLSAAEKWDWNTAKTELWIKLKNSDALALENLDRRKYLGIKNAESTLRSDGLGVSGASPITGLTHTGRFYMKLTITGNTVR